MVERLHVRGSGAGAELDPRAGGVVLSCTQNFRMVLCHLY